MERVIILHLYLKLGGVFTPFFMYVVHHIKAVTVKGAHLRVNELESETREGHRSSRQLFIPSKIQSTSVQSQFVSAESDYFVLFCIFIILWIVSCDIY